MRLNFVKSLKIARDSEKFTEKYGELVATSTFYFSKEKIEFYRFEKSGYYTNIAKNLRFLVELGCNITAAMTWTHNSRTTNIFYVEGGLKGG